MHFFSLFLKIFHFLLNILGMLLICCSFSKPEFSSEADPLPKSSSSLQLIPYPVKCVKFRPATCSCFPGTQQGNCAQSLDCKAGFISHHTQVPVFESRRTRILHITGSLLIKYQTVSPVLKTLPGQHWLSISANPENFGLVISSPLFQTCISI